MIIREINYTTRDIEESNNLKTIEGRKVGIDGQTETLVDKKGWLHQKE